MTVPALLGRPERPRICCRDRGTNQRVAFGIYRGNEIFQSQFYLIHEFVEGMKCIHNSNVSGLCLVRRAGYLDSILACEYLRGGEGGREKEGREGGREQGREGEMEG